MDDPTVRPDAAQPRSPSYELYVAFVVSLIPQAAALLSGGYGQLITNAPLAVVITIVDAVAIVVAYFQFREDSEAHRPSHWLVWATIAVGAVWLVYALLVGVVLVLGRVFCVSQTCRGPIR